jgi:preprotein translocase subunit SecE
MATKTDSTDGVKDVKTRTSPAQFIREVRIETAKVTWPTRREWMTTTVMVFIMVVIATIFFFFVDFILQNGVRFVLSLGG